MITLTRTIRRGVWNFLHKFNLYLILLSAHHFYSSLIQQASYKPGLVQNLDPQKKKFSFSPFIEFDFVFCSGLLQANDMEEIFELVNREADLSMNRVVVMIKDYEMQDQVGLIRQNVLQTCSK